jgi:DNA (cytosine-5)-methyltransferase 1
MEQPNEAARDALADALSRFPKAQLAEELSITTKTLDGWLNKHIPSPGLVYHAVHGFLESRKHIADEGEAPFRFIDLFAGIGGIRLGFEAHGGKCVFTSEWDKFSTQTYRENFKEDEHAIHGDIRAITKDPQTISEMIPDHDVLLAGFPCQPFSIAGVSKKNSLGRAHGFECKTQGTLFYEIAKIIDEKKPSAFLLENVKNLKSHDKGRTYQTILDVLRNDLGYFVPEPRIIDGKHFVPQHRERIIIAGFRKPVAFDWDSLELPDLDAAPRLGSILQQESEIDKKYILTKNLWEYLQNYARKHKAKGNGFGFGKVGPDDTTRTLSARYYKDGSEILVKRGKTGRARPRRLTPRECARLMGFPETFEIPVSDTQAYKQFGNSVVVPVIEAVAGVMYPHILTLKQEQELGEDQYMMVV